MTSPLLRSLGLGWTPRTILSILTPTISAKAAYRHAAPAISQHSLSLWASQPWSSLYQQQHDSSSDPRHASTTLPAHPGAPTRARANAWGLCELQKHNHHWGDYHSHLRTSLPLPLLAALTSPAHAAGPEEGEEEGDHDPDAEGVRADLDPSEVAWKVLREHPGAPAAALLQAVRDEYAKMDGLIPTPSDNVIRKALASAKQQRKELNYDVSLDQLPLFLHQEPCLLALNSNPALALKPESLVILREFLRLVKNNTLKNFGGKQYTFLKWNLVNNLTTKVSGGNVLTFLLREVLAKKPQTSYDRLNDWVKALVHLQKAQGMATLLDGNSFGDKEHIRQHMPLNGLLANTSENEYERKKHAYLDPQQNLGGYDMKQYGDMSDFYLRFNGKGQLWDNTKDFSALAYQVELQLKYRCLQHLQHGSLMRGDNARTVHLSHCGMVPVPSLVVEPQQCHALRMVLNHGKTNGCNRQDFGFCLPHSDVRMCGHGSTALWLYYRYHAKGERWDFSSNEAWFDVALIPGKDTNKELSYQAQYERNKPVLAHAGVNCKAVTHTGRGSNAREAVAQGCPVSDITRAGNWSAERVDKHYLCLINIPAATALAGYIPGTYDPYRVDVMPPQCLIDAIFPEVDANIKTVKEEDSKLPANLRRHALPNFLFYLSKSRISVLQDFAVLTDLYPDFPLWREPFTKALISSTPFQNFRVRMRAARHAADAAMNPPLNQQTVNKERAENVKVRQHYQQVINKLQSEKAQGLIHQLPPGLELEAAVSFLQQPADALQLPTAARTPVPSAEMCDIKRQLTDLTLAMTQMMGMMANIPAPGLNQPLQPSAPYLNQQPGTSQAARYQPTQTAAPSTALYSSPPPNSALSHAPGPVFSSPTSERKREIAAFFKELSSNPKAVQFATGHMNLALACSTQTRVSQQLLAPPVLGLLQAHGSPLHAMLVGIAGRASPAGHSLHTQGNQPHSRRRLGFEADGQSPQTRLQLGRSLQPSPAQAATAALQQSSAPSLLMDNLQLASMPALPTHTMQQHETFAPFPTTAPYIVPGSLAHVTTQQALAIQPTALPQLLQPRVAQTAVCPQSLHGMALESEESFTPPVPKVAYAVPGSLDTIPAPPVPICERPPRYKMPLPSTVPAAWREWCEEIVPRDALGIAWRTKTPESGLSTKEAAGMNSKHSRYLVLVSYIKARETATGSSIEDAVSYVESVRTSRNITISSLIDQIVAERKQAAIDAKAAKAAADLAVAAAAPITPA